MDIFVKLLFLTSLEYILFRNIVIMPVAAALTFESSDYPSETLKLHKTSWIQSYPTLISSDSLLYEVALIERIKYINSHDLIFLKTFINCQIEKPNFLNVEIRSILSKNKPRI